MTARQDPPEAQPPDRFLESRANPERQTFLELQEILTRALESIASIRRALETAPVAGDRNRIFVDALVRLRLELEGAIDRCLLDAPPELLSTTVQYAGGRSAVAGAMPGSVGGSEPEEVARWLMAADEALSAALLDLARRIPNPAPREFLESVVRLVSAHDRRVALQLHDLRDV